MKTKLLKYQLGLLVLGLLTIGLVVVVLVQAGATKRDTTVYQQANKVADKLNSYVESAGTVPESLAAAGISRPDAAISYQKLSASSYRFCVTYRANSSDFDPSAVADTLATAGALGSGLTTWDTSSDSYLTVSAAHHRGANCQTIKPYGTGGSGSGCGASGLLCMQPLQGEQTSPSAASSTSRNATATDTKRQTDLRALQAVLEASAATTFSYPTLAELNSASWRAANLHGLDAASLCDPSAPTGQPCQLTASPQPGSYSYAPTDFDGTSCTASGQCFDYTLTATLSSGQTFTLRSQFSADSN